MRNPKLIAALIVALMALSAARCHADELADLSARVQALETGNSQVQTLPVRVIVRHARSVHRNAVTRIFACHVESARFVCGYYPKV